MAGLRDAAGRFRLLPRRRDAPAIDTTSIAPYRATVLSVMQITLPMPRA